MRKKYILLKDTPELKKRAIVEEACDNGDQNYFVITKNNIKFKDQTGVEFTRDTVMKNPEWFEEIISIEVPKEFKNEVEKFIKKLKK
jgi:hypothetical protein